MHVGGMCIHIVQDVNTSKVNSYFENIKFQSMYIT